MGTAKLTGFVVVASVLFGFFLCSVWIAAGSLAERVGFVVRFPL